MDRLSCGTCKHFNDVGYRNWGECTASVPRWAWFEYIMPSRRVARDGGTADLAPDCDAYKPNDKLSGGTPCSACGGTGQNDPPPGKYHGLCLKCGGKG